MDKRATDGPSGPTLALVRSAEFIQEGLIGRTKMIRLAAITTCCVLATGCTTAPEGPAFLTIDAARYSEAFDAAMAASRANDMSPSLRDRRLGVIDTEPSIAGSVIEPWRSANDSLSEAWENTLVFQRRRARFEFTPASFREPQGTGGPDLLGVAGSPLDLTTYQGPVELRVSVIVERSFTPGIRRDTWSSRGVTRTVILRPVSSPRTPTTPFWTPVTRDTAFERRLLAEVAVTLGAE